MRFMLNAKSKNGRWPFPTLHVNSQSSLWSDCGKISIADERITVIANRFELDNYLYTVCEKCVHSRPTLREKLYNTRREK